MFDVFYQKKVFFQLFVFRFYIFDVTFFDIFCSDKCFCLQIFFVYFLFFEVFHQHFSIFFGEFLFLLKNF